MKSDPAAWASPKVYEPGFLHVDVKYLPQMADETTRRYLFVAIDRATRWVFVRIMPAKTAANARRFLRDLSRACPIRIVKILTDNGKEFTDRLFASRARAACGSHEFDQLCAELGIEHRLTPPKSPQSEPLSAIGPRTMARGAPAIDAAIPMLSQLLKAELAEREVRSIAYHMKSARFPA